MISLYKYKCKNIKEKSVFFQNLGREKISLCYNFTFLNMNVFLQSPDPHRLDTQSLDPHGDSSM